MASGGHSRLKINVEADNLREIRNRLVLYKQESPILNLRVDYNENAKVIDYLNSVRLVERVYHHLLPTQASGRWSVTNPPLVNFPDEIRDIVLPDPGEAWIGFDFDAIEGKLVAGYSHDREDLEAFSKSYDIHTITACKMIGLELPPNLANPHTSPECAEWRARVGWKGKEDRRRILAKVRYCLLYGKDDSAINGSKYEKDMVKMGFDRDILKNAAKQFLRSKPNLIATKRKYWNQCALKGEARTLLGRRRRLFGDWWMKAKEGWNHMIQGTVSDMLDLALIELCPRYGRLVFPSHDAAKIAVTLGQEEELLPSFKQAVEKDWNVDGEIIRSTATWKLYFPDGSVKHL